MLCSLLALLLLSASLGTQAQTIQQWPAARVQTVGSSLTLECKVTGTSNPNLYWYRQAAGGALQQLFYSISADQVDAVASHGLTASRSKDGQFFLSSEKLLLSDSGLESHTALGGADICAKTPPTPQPSPPALPRSPYPETGGRCW